MKKPSLFVSLIPFALLIAMLVLSSMIFGDNMSSGPSQVSLLTGAMFASLIGVYFLKVPWSEFEEHIGRNFKDTSIPFIIVIMVGGLNASWMLSGVVPTIIVYGLKVISPKIFLAATFLLCGVVSIMLGSSWTTVGTIGLAMFGAGKIIGLPSEWLAGSIISGAYLGDKLSPLSDTTIMASSIVGVDLYKHIRYMLITTIPAVLIALAVFLVVGFTFPVNDSASVAYQVNVLHDSFNISPWLLLIPIFTIVLLVRRVNVLVTLLSSSLIAAVVTCLAQPMVMSQIGDTSSVCPVFRNVVQILAMPNTVVTQSDMINSLASTGGMAKMLNTVWLIMSLLVFGATMSASGMLSTITTYILKAAKTTFSLVAATMASCLCCEFVLSDQYTSIIIPGNMFKDAYRKRGLAPEVLSRTVEDCGTTCSVLVPWNSCGVMQSSLLGVATLAYAPYCIFNIASPVMGLIITAIGYKIHKIDDTASDTTDEN